MRINLLAVVGRKLRERDVGRVLTGQFGDHFREPATGAIGGIRQAKIFEDLQESLLLIKKPEVFPGAIGLAEEALADDGQAPIAQLRPDFFVRFPVGLIRGNQHRMNDVRQNLVDPGLAEQMEWPDRGSRGKREMVIPERMGQSADPFCDFFESRRQQSNLLPAADQFGKRTETSMGMIAWPGHAESPEILVKDQVGKLAPELPPVLPKVAPIVPIDGAGLVEFAVLQKACDAEEETFRGRPLVTKQLEFSSLSQHQKRDLVQLVAERDGERLEEGFVHAMSDRCPMELIRLPLHADASSRLDQRIDRPRRQLSERSATTPRMSNWRGLDLQQVNFALQMNLDDLPILGRPRKMAGAAFVKEQMKDHPIKGRVLRMAVPVPVCDVHVQFDISLQHLFPVHPERGMNEIGAGLPIPESELNDLDEGAGNSAESGAKRAGIPHRLPFELGPLFGEVPGRFSQQRRDPGARLLIEGLVGGRERFSLRLESCNIK